ncbi:hypothetical protein [Pseudonocardia endophytica]|uniref:hypothetical protein n=1 Tax=Pseudonocardia endophytica TaxID=401976 RepID=UPI0014052D56|nr:hypothetical protein [Pseudonocardia endophytica]
MNYADAVLLEAIGSGATVRAGVPNDMTSFVISGRVRMRAGCRPDPDRRADRGRA